MVRVLGSAATRVLVADIRCLVATSAVVIPLGGGGIALPAGLVAQPALIIGFRGDGTVLRFLVVIDPHGAVLTLWSHLPFGCDATRLDRDVAVTRLLQRAGSGGNGPHQAT